MRHRSLGPSVFIGCPKKKCSEWQERVKVDAPGTPFLEVTRTVFRSFGSAELSNCFEQQKG